MVCLAAWNYGEIMQLAYVFDGNIATNSVNCLSQDFAPDCTRPSGFKHGWCMFATVPSTNKSSTGPILMRRCADPWPQIRMLGWSVSIRVVEIRQAYDVWSGDLAVACPDAQRHACLMSFCVSHAQPQL
jgi:hypothetical protein